MKPHEPKLSQLTARVDFVLNGLTSGDDMTCIEELLRDDVAAQRCYLRYMALHADLRYNPNSLFRNGTFSVKQLVSDEPKSGSLSMTRGATLERTPVLSFFGKIISQAKNSTVLATLLLATVFYGAFGLLVWSMKGSNLLQHYAANGSSAQSESFVAKVSQSPDCVWRQTPMQSNVDTGNFCVDKGTAEITLRSGARISLEGPVTFEVDGPNQIRLTYGRLFATVPPVAVGFKVQTPAADIVDLGTEFGVVVDDAEQTEIHVFRGEVRAESRRAGPGTQRSMLLQANKAVVIDSRLFHPRSISIDPTRFAAMVQRSEVRAGFSQGNGNTAPDQFPGCSGEGWLTRWKTQVLNASFVEESCVDDVKPLDSQSGARLLIAAKGKENSDSYAVSVSRFCNPGRGMAPSGAPYRIRFKLRLDSPLDRFNGLHDSVVLFNAPFPQASTDEKCTWIIKTIGASSGDWTAHEWLFVEGDGKGKDTTAIVHSGMPLVSGTIYEFAISVYPKQGQWSATISDGVKTVDSMKLTEGRRFIFRSSVLRAENYLHFGLGFEQANKTLAYSIDDVCIDLIK